MSSKPKKIPKSKDTNPNKYISIEPKRKYKVEPTKRSAVVEKGIKTFKNI